MELIEERIVAATPADTSPRAIDLASLVHTHASLLFRVAHSVLHNTTEAEDTVQDTFVRVLQHRQTLHTVQNLRVWLIRITWNLALDRTRRRHPEQLDQLVADTLATQQLSAEQTLVASQRLHAVFAAMETLPTAERRVLLLAAIDELSPAEIAAILGRSEAAIRGLLFRARKRLSQRLERRSPHAASR